MTPDAKFGAKIRESFGADYRSLAALRIGIAAVVLGDLLARAGNLVAHYSDAGVLPRSALLTLAAPWKLSIHTISGAWQIQAMLFIFAGLVAVALLLGYRTRASSIISWFLLISLHGRNYFILNNGDALLRILLFWGMFLPWGERWSLDSIRRESGPQSSKIVFSAATVAYILQVLFVYFFTVLHKSGLAWQRDLSAVYYAISAEPTARSLANLLLPHQQLMEFLTFAVLAYLIIGPLLLLSPIWTGSLRTAAVFGFAAMHIAIGFFLSIGMFTWIAAVSAVGFLPSLFWDFVEKSRIGAVFKGLHWHSDSRQGRPAYASSRNYLFHFRRLAAAIPGVLIACALFLNIESLPGAPEIVPKKLRNVIQSLHLDQKWNMFSPNPPNKSISYQIIGTMRDGMGMNDAAGFEAGHGALFPVYEVHDGARWSKFYNNLSKPKWPSLSPYYGHYICRRWNLDHVGENSLEHVEIYTITKKIPAFGAAWPKPQRRLLWGGRCEA